MIRINLLPYRIERRRGQILRYVLVALGALLVTLLLLLASYSWTSMRVDDAKNELANIQARNHALKVKIGELSKFQDVQAEVKQKLELVDRLQRDRFRSLISLQALSLAIPKNVWLTQVHDNGGSISLTGLGESNRAVSSFMRALEGRKEFSNVSLQVIRRQSVGGVTLRSFSLTMNRVADTAQPAPKDGKSGGKG